MDGLPKKRVKKGGKKRSLPAEKEKPIEEVRAEEEEIEEAKEEVGEAIVEEADLVVEKEEPIPNAPRGKGKVIVVLENCLLEAVKYGNEYQLLTSDDHTALMKRRGRDPNVARPDIVHSSLLMLMDSPLNKAGRLQVYLHTQSNVLIEVNPRTRIPRTFKRFAGLMVQLLQKLSVHAVNGPDKLLSVVRNPVTQYFPVGAKVVGTSVNAKSLVQIDDFVKDVFTPDETAVFVLGGMSHGKIDVDYVNVEIAFSEYPLSAAVACCKVCSAFEKLFGIL